MDKIDIAPFALPNVPAGEYWFEESRDLREIVVHFRKKAPRRLEIHYWQNKWPRTRPEDSGDLKDPAGFGWSGTDDWFNGRWQPAQTRKTVAGKTVTLQFKGLLADRVADTPAGYDVDFRRTMGLKVVVPDWQQVAKVEIHTRSAPAQTTLRVELDAGKRTRGMELAIGGYNAWIFSLKPLRGVALMPVLVQSIAPGKDSKTRTAEGAKEEKRQPRQRWRLKQGRNRGFGIDVWHMDPAHRYAGDTGLVEFRLDHDTFTLSLEALRDQGPIWYAEEGIYITRADDPTPFAQYRQNHARARTVNQQVADRQEQSYARAYLGQPRPHPVAYSFGCKHSPQRFWLDPNGDLVLHKGNLTRLAQPGPAARRFLNKGNARFFFGLEEWVATGRCPDPPPVPIYHLRFRQDGLQLEQQSLCVPLHRSILAGELGFDDPTVALLRFTFANTGPEPVEARLPIRYSEDSGRHRHSLRPDPNQTDHLVPKSPLVPLQFKGGRITSQHQGQEVLRAVCDTDMQASLAGEALLFHRWLQPGEQGHLLLKIPYLALQSRREIAALRALDFAQSHGEVTAFWRAENQTGAQLRSPIPQLNTLHAAHLTHVEITDFAMPGAPDLLNTSVGTSTYGNFSNESCMIIQELEQRGLHRDCRRRLDLWVKYQGTATQPGNFADYQGMYFGAGGFEQGHYNQHHGWILWALAEHFLITRDESWFAGVADSLVEGADWIFRQRRQTLADQPRSRGWERGFLPAGSLEDVTEFYYWLSTNCLTWRGAATAARALQVAGHPQAARVRTEADAFRQDLIAGFETMRQHTPLIRLRDGRWIPHYPSRLYCRGRDQGWIREVLEGAVYLLLSGLYDPRSRQAAWILDDYQDNLYLTPPYGYVLRDPEVNLFNRGGFSIQPCLLAGLLPHLERDEPEIYLWMFFNAFAAIYREEISGMIEHPLPELGFSNSVTFKTSDEANAVIWLRYIYVYWNQRLLHFGRALPRAWFAKDSPIELARVSTHFGQVGIRYQPDLASQRITAQVDLGCLRDAPQVLVRFRHPDKAPLKSVRVAGQIWTAFAGEDVDLTNSTGSVAVEATF